MAKFVDIELIEDLGDVGRFGNRRRLQVGLGELAAGGLDVGDHVGDRGGEVLGADLGDVEGAVELVALRLGGLERGLARSPGRRFAAGR